MNWLSNNWKLLFEGVGGTAAVSIIGYVCKQLFWPQSSGQDANLTAQGARVSDSPVASGSGITQNINSPTIHVNLPHPPPTAITILAQPELMPGQRDVPRSQITVTATRVIGVSLTGPNEWSETGQYARQEAIIIQFTNEAAAGRLAQEPIVRASLIYRDGQNELLRITGGWINQISDLAKFRIDESHRLIAGVLDQELVAIQQRRSVVGLGSEICNMTQRALPGFQQGTVRVRLTDIHAQTLLYEGVFDISTNPLRISQVPSA